MATKKKIGKFRIEETRTEAIVLENGLKLSIFKNATNKNLIDYVRIEGQPTDGRILTFSLIQAAAALVEVDETKAFVCVSHGNYSVPSTQRQPPKCPRCFETEALEISRRVDVAMMEDNDA